MIKWLPVFAFVFLVVSCENSPTSKNDASSAAVNPLDSINDLIKAEPSNADLYFERAIIHFDSRDVASSLSDVGRALKLDSNQADYYILLANLKILTKQSRETKDALLKAYSIDPKNIDVLLKLGELYMLVEEFKTSFKYLNEALELDIHNATAYRLKGFNYKYAGDTAKCISSFQTAIEQDPSDYDSYLQLALLYSVPLDPIALDYYDNALKVRPTSLEALYAKALHLQNIDELRSAINIYDQIIDLNKAYFNSYYNKGYIYLEMMNKYDSAALCFSDAITNGPPNYFQAVYNRGLAFERAGNIEKAIENYRLALEMNPQYDFAAVALSRVTE